MENKGRGYGFVSFLDPMDCAKAIREMNDKYLGTRPMKIRKSTWKDRDIEKVLSNFIESISPLLFVYFTFVLGERKRT